MSYTLPPSIVTLLAAIDAGAFKTREERETAIRQQGEKFVQLALIRQWLAATGGTAWGAITGTVTDQTDLVNYIASVVAGVLDFKGNTNCSGNPNYPAALKGDAYVVSVAGKIGGASGKVVEVGDMYVASADNAGGAEGSVGTSWFVLQANITGITTAGLSLMRGPVSADPSTGQLSFPAAPGWWLTEVGGDSGIYNLGGGLVAIVRAGSTKAAFGSTGIGMQSNAVLHFGATPYSPDSYGPTQISEFSPGVLKLQGIVTSGRTVTANDTVDSTPGDYTIEGNHTTVPITQTLVAASANPWRMLSFFNSGAADMTIDGTGLGQIFTTALVNTFVLHTGDSLDLQSNGTFWKVK